VVHKRAFFSPPPTILNQVKSAPNKKMSRYVGTGSLCCPRNFKVYENFT